MSKQFTKVAVIGGGLAGLTAAAFLRKHSVAVTVFESTGSFGGRARTLNKDGYNVNLGPHALYIAGAANAILKELGIEIKGGPPPAKKGLAITENDLFELPLSPKSIITTGLLSPLEKLELIIWFAKATKAPAHEFSGVSLSQWLQNIRSEKVKQLLRTFFRLSTYISAPDLLSAGSALSQLQMASKQSVLYPNGGWAQIVDALVDLNKSLGSNLVLDCPIKEVRETDQNVEIVTRDGQIHSFEYVILALPPDKVLRVLGSACPAKLKDSIDQLIPVRACCLDVCLSRLPNQSAQFALGIDRSLYFSVHSINSQLAPQNGVVLHVAKYLEPGEKADRETESLLIDLLNRLQPGWQGLTVFKRFLPEITVVHRLPTWQVEGSRSYPRVKAEGLNKVRFTGDWIGTGHLLLDSSLASAREAACEILNIQ